MEIRWDTRIDEVMGLSHPCSCESCRSGCRFGSGALADEDLEKMAKLLHVTVDELKEKYLEEIEKFRTRRYRPKIERKGHLPFGKCIFFDEKKGCGVHEAKPLECRLAMPCKEYGEDMIIWFDHKHFVNLDDPESVREWVMHVGAGAKTLKGGDPESVLGKMRLKEIKDLKDRKDIVDKDWEKETGLR